ncbi:hypothetical protein JG688_00010323 [Phytophthora aleatoria]|uniref:Uncharacterized protein n=1 Tax=Phytophthora aleatoria TaxID=2496075 RepID=A0A8J5J550_9STRA|nr:hypothetical protein JG688_00010323 [Phytophthora aleatoria]
MVGELQDKLRSDEAEAAAVRHFVTSALMAQEKLEQYLRTANAQVMSYQIENRRLREANTWTAALLVKTKEPIAGHNENLRLLRLQIQDRDNTIVGLSQQVTNERETFKAAIGANTEQTHLQKLNTHLLHVNRTPRTHENLVGIDPNILLMAEQGLATAGRGFNPNADPSIFVQAEGMEATAEEAS